MQTSLKRNMIVLALSRCQFAANYPLMSPLQNVIPGNVYEFADRIIPLPSCPPPSVMPAPFRHACAFRHARALPSCPRPSVMPAPFRHACAFRYACVLLSCPPPFVISAPFRHSREGGNPGWVFKEGPREREATEPPSGTTAYPLHCYVQGGPASPSGFPLPDNKCRGQVSRE